MPVANFVMPSNKSLLSNSRVAGVSTFQHDLDAAPIVLNDLPGDDTCCIRITRPGHYVLCEDLRGVPGKCGVSIQSDDVVVDLAGHELVGCSGSTDGITVAPLATGITIRSGTVRSWGRDGVDLSNAVGCTAQDLTVRDNGAFGLLLGCGARIDRCTVGRNGQGEVAAI